MMPEKVVIFGAGGHAKVVIDAIEREGRYEIAFLADADTSRCGTATLGYPVRSEEDGFAAPGVGIVRAIVAIGNNVTRRRIADTAMRFGLMLVNAVHPAATVARTARLGVGTLVMPGSIVNADARIGDNVIINSGAIVEHDCEVGDDVHIAPNATLCGGVIVGAAALVGAGAVVLPGVRIGSSLLVKAGTVVARDMKESS